MYILPAFPYFYTKFLHKNILIMGRGDKRTKKGKISKGSFGKTRLARRVKKVTPVVVTPTENKEE